MSRSRKRTLFAGDVQRAVQLEEFLDDVAFGDPVPAGRGIRNLFDHVSLQQEVNVVAHRLPGDAGMIGELRLVELPTWRKGKEGVNENEDTLVLKEMEDASRVLRRASLVSFSSAGCVGVDSLMYLLCRPAYIIVCLGVNRR